MENPRGCKSLPVLSLTFTLKCFLNHVSLLKPSLAGNDGGCLGDWPGLYTPISHGGEEKLRECIAPQKVSLEPSCQSCLSSFQKWEIKELFSIPFLNGGRWFWRTWLTKLKKASLEWLERRKEKRGMIFFCHSPLSACTWHYQFLFLAPSSSLATKLHFQLLDRHFHWNLPMPSQVPQK